MIKHTKYRIGDRVLDAIDLTGMTYQEWQVYRKGSTQIGGSEIGAILNLNPYQDALTLWAKRIGFTPDEFLPNEASEGGHIDEAGVLTRLEHWDGNVWAPHRATGKTFRTIEKPTVTFTPAHAPYMALNVDGIVQGDVDYPDMIGVAEAKKINGSIAARYTGGVPTHYLGQLVGYMYYLGADFGRIALLEDGVRLNVMTIDRGMPEYERFVERFWRLPRFYEAVIEGRDMMSSDLPAKEKRGAVLDLMIKYSDILTITDRSDDFAKSLRDDRPYIVIRDSGLDELATDVQRLTAEKKDIDAALDAAKNRIRIAMERSGASKVVGRTWTLSNNKYLSITRSK